MILMEKLTENLKMNFLSNTCDLWNTVNFWKKCNNMKSKVA